MADVVDLGNATAEFELRVNLERAKQCTGDVLQPIGECYYCGEYVRGNLRFCDATCRDDYEFEAAMRRRGGEGGSVSRQCLITLALLSGGAYLAGLIAAVGRVAGWWN